MFIARRTSVQYVVLETSNVSPHSFGAKCSLPLISSGGSSLVSTFLSFGILLGISSMNAEDEARDIDRLEMREEVEM